VPIQEGFFDDIPQVKKESTGTTCGSCGLYTQVLSPRMEPFGEFKLRILNVGEAPGCISGESLVETAYRNKRKFPNGIPIKDLVGKSNFYVYSFDTQKQELALGRVKRVWKTGRKRLYRVTYEWWYARKKRRERLQNSIEVTLNHPFLLKEWIHHDPFLGLQEDRDYLSIKEGLTIGHSLQPFHRRQYKYSQIGSGSSSLKKESRFLLTNKIGKPLTEKQDCHHMNGDNLDDSYDNLQLLSKREHTRTHLKIRGNPMENPIHRRTHAKIMKTSWYRIKQSKIMSDMLKDPIQYKRRIEQIHKSNPARSRTLKEKYKDPNFYFKYLKAHQSDHGWSDEDVKKRFATKFPIKDNHKIVSIEYIGIKDVYDMEVETYHNFAVNGIFVHNSEEDRRGKQWQGKVGQVLQEAYKELGFDLFRDCLNTNTICCRPTNKDGNRPPTPNEVSCCRSRLLNVIETNKPHVIMMFGQHAISSIIGPRWKSDLGTISKWRGWTIPDRDLNAWLCPTFHPSYVERGDKEIRTIWMQDLERALCLVNKPLPEYEDETQQVAIVKDLSFLDSLKGPVAFDYETTGLKPHDTSKHKIICMGVCNDPKRAYAFMMPEDPTQLDCIRALLQGQRGKIAQNMKFEHTWTHNLLGYEVKHWIWDTMLATHVMDNRPDVTGLKFQVYVNFGVVDYSSEVAPFLKAKDQKNGNAVNQIEALTTSLTGKKKLLKYCGMDALFEFRLAMKQMKEFKYDIYSH
jgi:uracil-DNA glycosylase family 4